MGKRFSRAAKDQMIARYLAGDSGACIAANFGASMTTVFAELRLAHIVLRGHHHNRICKRKSEIAELYRTGLTGPAIADRLGCSFSLIYKYAREMGLVIRKTSETNRVYALDQSAFTTPSTDRDYWLGFILADGCNRKNGSGKSLRVALAEKDYDHLVKFNTFLGHGGPILLNDNSKGYGSGRLAILDVHCTEMVKGLEQFGIVPRKSGKEIMPDSLLSSVPAWRGYVDGDGWVSISKKFRPEIGVTGSERLCGQFADLVEMVVGKRFPIKPNPPIWKVAVTCKAAVAMANVLYNAPGPALRRKQITAHAILAAQWNNRGEGFVPLRLQRPRGTKRKCYWPPNGL